MNIVRLFVIIFFSICTLSSSGQPNLSHDDSTAILKVFYAQQDAWNEANIEAFMEGYWKSDRLVFVGAAGPTYGWQPVKENYYKRYPDKAAMGKLEFTVIELSRLDENSAFQIGKFHLTRTIGDLEGYFSLVWKKMDGQWLVVSDHTTASTGS